MIQELLEFPWDDFLPLVQERTVIPVIGDAILFNDEETVSQVLAHRLAPRLRLDDAPGTGLRTLAGSYLDGKGSKKELYPRLFNAVTELAGPVPPLLAQIAAITDFPLIVSLSVDGLAARAIQEQRGVVQPMAFYPKAAPVPDIGKDLPQLAVPVVYQLFGKSSPSANHVITDEDLLEFLTQLHNPLLRPPMLFGSLKQYHLLFLGTSLPDWGMRTLLRLTRDELLSRRRDGSEYVVGLPDHPTLEEFLRRFSEETSLINATPEEFVAELYTRWSARQPPAQPPAGPVANLPDPGQARGKIFISYVHEDRDAVERLVRQFDAAGIETWFDKDSLKCGDIYDNLIRSAIQNCSYFMPVISENIMNSDERYVFKEWSWAIERSPHRARTRPFLLPVLVDRADMKSDWIDEPIRKSSWGIAPGGDADAELVARIVQLVRDARRGAP